VARKHQNHGRTQKKSRSIDREFTTALYLLRCAEVGLSMSDLDLLDMGMVYDILTEKGNDSYKGWRQVATQDDFDRF